MKDIKEYFPNYRGTWVSDVTYDELIGSMGLYPVIMLEEEDYSGDSIALLRDSENDYGILTFSWGSCSGCDALQSCENYEELESLRKSLFDKIHWEGKIRDQNYHGYRGKKIAQWWLDRDVEALESISSELNDKFCDMLRKFFEIKITPATDVEKAENLLTQHGIELQIRERHESYYEPWVLLKYNGEVILDEQCTVNNVADKGHKNDFR